MKKWVDEHYKEIMLVAMLVEISLMAFLCGLELLMLRAMK